MRRHGIEASSKYSICLLSIKIPVLQETSSYVRAVPQDNRGDFDQFTEWMQSLDEETQALLVHISCKSCPYGICCGVRPTMRLMRGMTTCKGRINLFRQIRGTRR